MKVEAVIFDCGRTLYDPIKLSLFPGARETLEGLSQMGIKLGLLSVAVTDDISPRLREIESFGLSSLFQSIDILQRSTIGKDFSRVLKDLGMENNMENCMVVDDNLKRGIQSANILGLYTVWTRQNLSADWQPQNEMQNPKFIINNIQELIPLVEDLNK